MGSPFLSGFGGGAAAPYTPTDTFATVGGAWYYGWDSTDLKVNSDGTGGAVADGGTVGQWQDRSGYGNHLSQSTASLRPVWLANTVRCFWATNTTTRQAYLSNTSTDAFPKQGFSGGMILDIPGVGASAIIDFGTSQCAISAGNAIAPNYQFIRTFNGATYQAGTRAYSARKCIITWRSNSSNLIVNVDGVEDALTALAVETMTRIWLGRFNGGAPKPMNYREIVVFDEDVGETIITSLRTYLQTQADTADIDTTKTVQIYGDSLSMGVGSETGKPWADYVTNRATSKWYTWSMDSGFLFSPHVTAANVALYKGSAEGVVVLWIGTNDILSGARTGAQTETSLWTYCDTLRTAGCKVIVCTLQDFATNRAEKDDFNTRVVANWASHADGLVRLDTAPELDDAADTTYFTSDGVHLKDTGYAAAGALIQTAMAALA